MSNANIGPIKIPTGLRSVVLGRDENTCQMCGATNADIDSGTMTIAVFPPQPSLARPDEVDLKTLCPDCAAGASTADFEPRMDAHELLVELRRATTRDQMTVLDWLLKKYPQRGAK